MTGIEEGSLASRHDLSVWERLHASGSGRKLEAFADGEWRCIGYCFPTKPDGTEHVVTFGEGREYIVEPAEISESHRLGYYAIVASGAQPYRILHQELYRGPEGYFMTSHFGFYAHVIATTTEHGPNNYVEEAKDRALKLGQLTYDPTAHIWESEFMRMLSKDELIRPILESLAAPEQDIPSEHVYFYRWWRGFHIETSMEDTSDKVL